MSEQLWSSTVQELYVQTTHVQLLAPRQASSGPCVQAFFGNMNAHACQRFSFLQAQDRYKERPNKNPLAGMVFRQAFSLSPFALALALMQACSHCFYSSSMIACAFIA